MLFNEVIGQQQVKQKLATMVHANHLSHALLFLGKQGAGPLPLALAFAQFLVCEKVTKANHSSKADLFGEGETAPTVFMDACGRCPGCTKAAQMIHPDIHYSYPVIPKKSGDKPKSTDYAPQWREFVLQGAYSNVYEWLQFLGAENKQGNITAEECSDIIRKLSLKSFESDYKILIMWMPEYLGKEGNKLLKLIEEPPPDTLFILVAESEELILPTILSRAQLVKIPLLHDEEVQEALIARNKTKPEEARLATNLAQGDYHEALQLLQHNQEDWSATLRDWITVTVRNNNTAQVKWIDEMAKTGREKQKQFLRYYNHLLEQCVRLRILGEGNINISDTEKDIAERLNKIASVTQQQALLEEIDKATYYIERNANAKMLFHALTIKMMHILRNKVVISVQ